MRRLLASLWTLAILAGCSIPGDTARKLDVVSPDKLLHVLVFAGFGILWLRAAPHALRRILASGLAFGLFTEVYQHLMPIDRSFDPFDLLADAVGLGLGFAIAHVMALLAERKVVQDAD